MCINFFPCKKEKKVSFIFPPPIFLSFLPSTFDIYSNGESVSILCSICVCTPQIETTFIFSPWIWKMANLPDGKGGKDLYFNLNLPKPNTSITTTSSGIFTRYTSGCGSSGSSSVCYCSDHQDYMCFNTSFLLLVNDNTTSTPTFVKIAKNCQLLPQHQQHKESCCEGGG